MKVTLEKIAQACGVSRGTVDRALKSKPGVRPELAERIIQTAQKMGYESPERTKENQAVKSQPKFKIGVILHSSNSEFVQMLLKQIRKTATQFSSKNVDVLIRYMENTEILHQIRLIEELVQKEEIDGLAIMPLASDTIRKKLNELSLYGGIPIVTVNTDVNISRLAYVGQDNYNAGRAAASLLGLCMEKKGVLLTISGLPGGHYADRQRVDGFIQEMETNFLQIKLIPVEYCFYDTLLTERITVEHLTNNPDINGIYVATSAQEGVYNAINRLHLKEKVHVIAHDLTDLSTKMLQEGMLDFVLGQDVYKQGYLPIQILYQYLSAQKKPKTTELKTDIQIKFKYNI